MKTSTVLALATALTTQAVQAFPAINLDQVASIAKHDDVKALRRRQQKRASTFDASSQHISTSGVNAFVAPNFDAGDQRGPCPGLNALANHGYLPHNGVASAEDILDSTQKVYGMSVDLSAFLALYGTVFDGNPLSLSPGYSIGGPAPSGLGDNILQGLGILGKPQGLSGSHNKYESDASPTRGDLFLYGNEYEVQVPQFQQYYDYLKANVSSDEQYEALFPYRVLRFEDSINRNDEFFYSPFAGILVSPAGFSFPKAMMANHSEEFPDGSLTHDNLMSFFSITGKSGSFEYTVGHERIPDNWYRRPANDYSIPAFLVDVLDHGLQDPRLLSAGGNTGGPNTFTPIDVGNLTGGVFNGATLAQGNNLLCFVLRSIQAAVPDVLGSTFADPAQAASSLLDNLMGQFSAYSCPELSNVDFSQYDAYPGYNKTQGAV